MMPNTRTIIECAMLQDPTMTEAEVEAVKRAMDWREGGDEALAAPMQEPPLQYVTYADAASRLGTGVHMVKRLINRGVLKRVYRGHARAVGVTPESLAVALRRR